MADEAEGELNVHGSIVLDSNGNGTVNFGVQNAWQRWVVDTVRVTTSQGANQTPFPTAEVFAGPGVSPGFSQGGTWTGNNDTFRGEVNVEDGSDLYVVFTGGVPGSTAYARVFGKKYTRVS